MVEAALEVVAVEEVTSVEVEVASEDAEAAEATSVEVEAVASVEVSIDSH